MCISGPHTQMVRDGRNEIRSCRQHRASVPLTRSKLASLQGPEAKHAHRLLTPIMMSSPMISVASDPEHINSQVQCLSGCAQTSLYIYLYIYGVSVASRNRLHTITFGNIRCELRLIYQDLTNAERYANISSFSSTRFLTRIYFLFLLHPN